MSKRKKKWHECNVVQIAEPAAHLWQFNASGRNFALKSETTEADGNPLPQKIVGKTWQNLIQGKLNIGWIPEDQVFLRTVQLPECDPEELKQMLEFQLEKLSPAPVAQIAWSYELIPSNVAGQVTVLLIIVESDVIEKNLASFELAGFQADRLEVPWCHELITLDRSSDRIWIRLGEHNDSIVALVGWILEGTLQNVMVMRLPNSDEGTLSLTEQLDRTAWTGELEAWLTTIPAVTVCGEASIIAPWIEALEAWSAHSVSSEASANPVDIATLGAKRATQGESLSNLLPEAHQVRYRQQYIDGMWMKGVGTMVLFYIFGILIYFVMLEWMHRDSIDLQTRVRSSAVQYTNVLKMQAHLDILQEQVDLKFSALECLRVISEELPTELTLDSFKFHMGKTLSLYGKVPTADAGKVTDYHRALINAKADDQKLFSTVSDPTINAARGRGRSASVESRWSFTCELERSGF